MQRKDELLQGVLRHDLTSFIGKVFGMVSPGVAYAHNWHIELIAEYLEAARRGEVKRLIINVPPRSLKSVCVSVAWPAWLLGHDPGSRIIAASYGAGLALKHSQDCRHVVQAGWYKKLFRDTRLVRGQNEKHKFMTTGRGYRFATSVGGTLTGEGGNYLIIDDPLNAVEAYHAASREFVNGWFDHAFATRLDNKREGVIVLVMQRLHPNDLTGHLLKKGGWEQLCLPAVAQQVTVHDFGRVRVRREKGGLLHEAREDEKLLERAKLDLGSRAFAAQYQQQPLAEEGAMVKPAWLGRYAARPPEFTRVVQSWDTAIKASDSADATVCMTFGEAGGKCYVLEVVRVRVEYPELRKLFLAQAAKWKPHMVLLEDRASGQQLLQDMRREQALPVVGVQPKYDKLTRFAAVSALMEAGRLVLPEYAHWLADLETELFSFPDSAHDDQVDALTQYLDFVRRSGVEAIRVRSI